MPRSPKRFQFGVQVIAFIVLQGNLDPAWGQQKPATTDGGKNTLPADVKLSPPDKPWSCNTILVDAKSYTLPGIGACQGVDWINNRLYFYGDRYDLNPRVGVMLEYSLNMKPTGRRLLLNVDGKPLLTHPTGIAYLDRHHVFVGNTVNQQAQIFLIDWALAWETGTLDGAVRATIIDDLANNGCRPIDIVLQGKRWIATADYGDQKNEIRILSPEKLARAKRTSEPGVLVKHFAIGPFNQNLEWDDHTGQLIAVQNVIAGKGWRLEWIDMNRMLLPQARNHRSKPPATQTASPKMVFPPHTELEGFRLLPNGRAVFVTAHQTNNVWIGKMESIEPKQSDPGFALPFFR